MSESINKKLDRMLLSLLTLAFAAPMGPGKAAGKGRADFDVKAIVSGEYNATLRVGLGDVQKTYQGALELINGTSSGLLKEVIVTGEGDNVTTEVLHSYNLEVEVLNKTAVDVKLEGSHVVTLAFEVDQDTGSVEARGKTAAGDAITAAIVNGNYFTLSVMRKDAQLFTYSISKKKVTPRVPVWQRLISPAMMLVSMFVSQRMKKMQMAAAPANPEPQGVEYPVDTASDAASAAATVEPESRRDRNEQDGEGAEEPDVE